MRLGVVAVAFNGPLSTVPLAAQEEPLQGRWVAIRGSLYGHPIPEAARPFVQFSFAEDSASWTLPGFPQRFGYRTYGTKEPDSLDFELPSEAGQQWTLPARVWRSGDTLELSLIMAEPFDPDRQGPPARPEQGPARVPKHLHVVLVREDASAARRTPQLNATESAAAEAVDAERIERWTRALVAPEMEGRGSGQPGGERAARTIAGWFDEAGLEPLGDDGFLQRVPLILARATSSSTLTVGDTTFRVGPDFQITGFAMRTRPAMRAELSGELVLFAGGVPRARAGAPLPRFDVSDKVVGWVLPSMPPGTDVFRTYQALHASGAAGLILVLPGPVPPPLLQSPFLNRVTALDADLFGSRPGLPLAVLGAAPFAAAFGDGAAVRQLLTRSPGSEPLVRPTGRQVTMAYQLEDVATAPTYNVVGVIRGSDPELREEAVVYTAHYDALGTVDGELYPGAADNALGTAEMIEVARAMVAAGVQPRRSIVFIAAGAEERGLLGSLHWVRNPTWPLDRVVANINMDGGDAEAYGPLHGVIGLVPSSGLENVAAQVAAPLGLMVLPNNEPPSRSSSDFHDFLNAGIPATQLMGIGGEPGLFPSRWQRFQGQLIHQPGDVIAESWSWTGARQMAQVYLLLGLRLANADERPTFPRSSPYSEADHPENTGGNR